jgi:hypothetical protein
MFGLAQLHGEFLAVYDALEDQGFLMCLLNASLEFFGADTL